MNKKSLSIFAILTCLCVLPQTSALSNESSHPYGSPENLQLCRTLKRQCVQKLENTSLRETLELLGGAFDFAIWIDRNVDDEQLVSLETTPSETVESTLNDLGGQTKTSYTFIGNTIYFASADRIEYIDYAYWQLSGELPFSGNIEARWEWSAGAEPKSILREACTRLSLDITDIDAIEHDHWKKGSINAMSVAGQLSVFLSGFGLRASVQDEHKIKLVPWSKPEDVAYDYDAKSFQTLGKERFEKWKQRAKPKITRTKSKATRIVASVAAHRELIQEMRTEVTSTASKDPGKGKAKPPNSKNKEEKLYSFKASGRFDAIVDAVAKSLGLTCEPWPLSGSIASRMIVIDVKNVNADQLIEKLGISASVKIQNDGKILDIQDLK